MIPVSIGVPPDSIIGPILFLIYINAFARLSSELKIDLFADDTTITLKL